MSIHESEKELILKQFGKHVRQIRKEKGVKASELASWCDTQKGSISRLENGGVNPSLLFLLKLSEALDIPLDELFKGFKIEK